MTINEAVETAEIHLDHPYVTTNPEFREAIQLLIEAGKCVASNRNPDLPVYIGKLPSETKD